MSEASRVRTRSHRRRCCAAGGFTLLEIVVAMAVVGLILGVVVSRMDSLLEWDMKKASNRLASTIRYLYNKAGTEGLYIRLNLDFEEQSYWVDATTDPFTLSAGEGAEGDKKKEQEKEKEKEKAGQQGANPEQAPAEGEAAPETEKAGEGPPALKPAEPTFTQVDEFLLKPTRLPDNVFFKDISVEHEPLPITGGKAVIHFFPNGYVEHAVINLRDEADETVYSLETNPVSGRVSVENRYRTIGKE